MYLRPDEVAKVLENTGFERDYVTDQAYGYRKGCTLRVCESRSADGAEPRW